MDDSLLQQENLKNLKLKRFLCFGTSVMVAISSIIILVEVSVLVSSLNSFLTTLNSVTPPIGKFFDGLNSTLINNTISQLNLTLYNKALSDFDKDINFVNWTQFGEDVALISNDLNNVTGIIEAIYRQLTGRMLG